MENNLNSDFYIKNLDLQPHVEKGYYKEIYRSDTIVDNKSILSSIYFLLKSGEITFFRKLNISDEIICYIKGKTLEILLIDPKGNITIEKLGSDLLNGEKLQTVIPACYIACFKCKKEENTEDFNLFACVCGPAFNYEDFKIIKIEDLKQEFKSIDICSIIKFREDL